MENLRLPLARFYEKHNPQKIEMIEKILGAYGIDGKNAGTVRLNESLRNEYGVDLTEFNDAPSKVGEVACVPTTAALRKSITPVNKRPPPPLMKKTLSPPAEAPDGNAEFLFVKSLYDFTGEVEGDLSFGKGQIIEIVDQSQDWWKGRYKDGKGKEKIGSFPKNYVQEISSQFVLSLKAAVETSKEQSFMGEVEASPTPPQTVTSLGNGNLTNTHSLKKESFKDINANDDESIPLEYSPDLVKDDMKATNYFKVILEVATSEFKYVSDLHTAQITFVEPLAARMGKEVSDTLFAGWESMLVVHERVLEELIMTLPNCDDMEMRFENNVTVRQQTSSGSLPTPAHGDHLSPDRKSMPLHRVSHTMLNSDLATVVSSDKSRKSLVEAAQKLDRLEDTYGRYLESGRFLSFTQRDERMALLSDWVVAQSSVFIKLSSFFKTSNPFIANYYTALETLENFSGEDLAFVSNLESKPILAGLKMRDFLIKPVQRVCKYPLLYREIIKSSPTEEVKACAQRAQAQLMIVADQVNNVMKQNEMGNARKLLELKQIIRPQSDLDVYGLNDHSCVLRRDGVLELVDWACSPGAPEHKTLPSLVDQIKGKFKGTIRGLLFPGQLLLAEEYSHFFKSRNRLAVVHAVRYHLWPEVRVEPVDNDKFVLHLKHDDNSASKGAWLSWRFCSGPGTRDGWVESLNEGIANVQAARKRESAARDHENKIKGRMIRSNSIDWIPAPPPRSAAHVGGNNLYSLMDELKTVQNHRSKDGGAKGIV